MIQNLQILRWLAALWVVLLHTSVDIVVPPAYLPDMPALLQALVGAGFAGVDVFFAISGAVMAESTRSASAGMGHSLRFLGTRLLRIYAGWWPFFGLYLLAFHCAGPAHLLAAGVVLRRHRGSDGHRLDIPPLDRTPAVPAPAPPAASALTKNKNVRWCLTD